jgi:hypothetical protein
MREFFLLTLIVTSTVQLCAQKPFPKNTFYGEFGGNGIWLSANYERQLSKKPGLGIHVGLGYASSDEKFRPTIPIGVNYLIGLGNQKSFIDAGVSVTVAERYVWDDSYHTQDVSHPYEAAVIPSLGYRHHTRYGLMWRISYTAIFTSYRTIPWFPSISLGWRL